MPIQKFSNLHKIAVVPILNKSTIRISNATFSKGYKGFESIELEINFLNASTGYTLPFNNSNAFPKLEANSIFFYHGGGAVYGIPRKCTELIFKVVELKNVDFEFVLTYDFYPGGI
ncbi:MAG: hypothetical protein K0S44_1686 [Bacteroidetes bacterium]|jgi:hypothetical protein|nr:hypothetical protein [Bacteroidota bacterium]